MADGEQLSNAGDEGWRDALSLQSQVERNFARPLPVVLLVRHSERVPSKGNALRACQAAECLIRVTSTGSGPGLPQPTTAW